MKYENSANIPFDVLIDRRGTNCSKWDDSPCEIKADDMLPMWTADMDFACPAAVIESMRARLEHPIFGYYALPERYKESIIRWQARRFGSDIQPEHIIPVASVLGGVAMAIQALTAKGDAILVSTPGYHAFFHAIQNNGRRMVTSPLIQEEDSFRMDYERMEKQIEEENVKLFILCSPHNPTGRIWTEDELTHLVDICWKHSVYIISDEIHADMTLTHPFLPILNIADPRAEKLTVALYAPTKTFNIAGLCTAYAIIKDADLSIRFQNALLASGLKVKNTLGVEALMAAYEQCDAWVDQLQEYLLENAKFAVDFIEKKIPSLHAYVPEATYFLWLDFSGTGLSQSEFVRKMEYEAHIVVTPGDSFLGGDHFIRLVAACPRSRLADALNRMKKIFQ